MTKVIFFGTKDIRELLLQKFIEIITKYGIILSEKKIIIATIKINFLGMHIKKKKGKGICDHWARKRCHFSKWKLHISSQPFQDVRDIPPIFFYWHHPPQLLTNLGDLSLLTKSVLFYLVSSSSTRSLSGPSVLHALFDKN